ELVIDQAPEPSARAVPSTVVPLVSNSVTVAPASAPLPVNIGAATLVMLSMLAEPESAAAVRSGAVGAAATLAMVTLRAEEARLGLRAMSVCLAVWPCTTLFRAELVIDQAPEPSAKAVPSTLVPLVS